MDKFARGESKAQGLLGSLQRCTTLVAAALLGSLLGGCVSGTQYEAQRSAERTLILKRPFYAQDEGAVLKITTVHTNTPMTVSSDAQLWVVGLDAQGHDVPLGPLAGVAYKSSGNSGSVVFADGHQVPVALGALQIRLCSGGARVKCDWVEDISGERLADAKGPLPQSVPFRISNQFNSLVLDNSFTDEAQVPAAMVNVQRIAAANEALKAKHEEYQKRTNETKEVNRVAAFKKANVGTSEFCESVMLVAPGHPVSSGTLFACERGKISLGELRAFGWEVTSMSRRPDKDMIGREGDSVSIGIRKIKKVG